MPILKKKEGNRVEDYRRVTLAPTSYKVYAEILARNRLRKEIEKKRIIRKTRQVLGVEEEQ